MSTMHKKNHWGKQYIRYLISYFAVLLIPLVILTYFYSSRFMKKFYEEIFNTVDLELEQLETQMSSQLISMENIVNQILLSDLPRQAEAAESPLDLSPVITSLSGFCAANPFISDIALFTEGQEYVVTKSSTCKSSYYLERMIKLQEDGSQTLPEELFTSSTPVCLPRQPIQNLDINQFSQDTVLFSFPLYSDYQKRKGTALFFIEDDSVQKLMNQKLQNYQAAIFILDQNGTVITSSESGNPADLMAAYSGNQNYLVRRYTSPESQWTYTAFLPDSQTTFSQVSAIMRDFILAIILILLIASFTIYVLQKINYTPVRRLKEKVSQIMPEKEERNELTAISNALDYLSSQNTLLSTRLEGSFTAVKNERLYRLISGAYASKEDFNLDCSELNLSLPYDGFFVSIFMFHKPAENLDLIAQNLKKQFSDHCVYYCLHNFRPDQVILLHNLGKDKWLGNEYFSRIQNYLSNKYNLSTTVGVGTLKHNTGQIGQSYMEAVSALDYRFVKGNGTVIGFQEALGANLAYMPYPHQEFELLRNALLRKNEEEIRNSIQNIIQFMEQGLIPLYQARNICYNLIHLVNEHCQSGKNNISSPLELSGMETAQEIIQMLRNWSRDLTGLSVPETQTVTLEKVLSYVDANCLNCEFSAYETAEYFHMPLPSFSKFFKDAMGQTVMDYIIALRMQKAKELLVSTDMALKDIAEQVGYYNLSSFTRRFKLHQGITPSEYRKQKSDPARKDS